MPSPSQRTGFRIHVIEDDEDIRAETIFALGELGFDAEGFGDAASFYKAFAVQPCDIVVVDIGLPGESGLAVVAHLRAVQRRLGLVLVTARGELEDRLLGLREGADAYLVKPVNMRELAETLNAVGRRLTAAPQENAAPASPAPAAWRLLEGDWILGDPEGRQMALTTSERAFLACLFGQRGTEASRDDLIRALGGDVFDFDEHRIDAIASRLRRKAAKLGMRLPLHAVRGKGYVLAN